VPVLALAAVDERGALNFMTLVLKQPTHSRVAKAWLARERRRFAGSALHTHFGTDVAVVSEQRA
jgi:hypothetical protein